MNDQTCNNCRHAAWDYTKRGSLHPSGNGACKATPAMKIPRALYLIGYRDIERTENPRMYFSGGRINRKQPHTDCPCWEANP